MEDPFDPSRRWLAQDSLLNRHGSFVASQFIASPNARPLLKDFIRLLVVGAGGLGCELLKDLALIGFLNLDVIDLDTIDVSNLNRQFLFGYQNLLFDVLDVLGSRPDDVGRPKAVVAAEKIQKRIPGLRVTPHFCRIEEKSKDFFDEFHCFVLGLDSLEARRYVNEIACSFLKYGLDGEPIGSTIKPIVDGGTEGFKGHARVILPGMTPCFECTLWLYPPQIKFPMCTLAETPRHFQTTPLRS